MAAENSEVFRLLAGLPVDIQTRLLAAAHSETYRQGEHIFAQGDAPSAFYIVMTGRIKVVRVTREGYENILCVRGPGDHFCPVSLLDRGDQLGRAEAMTDCSVLRIKKDDFLQLCDECPELLALVQGDCLAEVRRLLHRLEVIAFRSVEQRVAYALLASSQREGSDVLRLTQQELGALIGASRESVSRTLSVFEGRGLVHLKRGRVTIANRRRLEEIAGWLHTANAV